MKIAKALIPLGLVGAGIYFIVTGQTETESDATQGGGYFKVNPSDQQGTNVYNVSFPDAVAQDNSLVDSFFSSSSKKESSTDDDSIYGPENLSSVSVPILPSTKKEISSSIDVANTSMFAGQEYSVVPESVSTSNKSAFDSVGIYYDPSVLNSSSATKKDTSAKSSEIDLSKAPKVIPEL